MYDIPASWRERTGENPVHLEVLRGKYSTGSGGSESKATVWIAHRMEPWMRYVVWPPQDDSI